MDIAAAQKFTDSVWGDAIVPELIEYIKIPNKSPNFDPDWQRHGHMEEAVTMVAGWCRCQTIPGLELEVVRLPGRTPLIYIDIPASDGARGWGRRLEMSGWDTGLGPWRPVPVTTDSSG